jgi:hypothetical protein
MSYSEQTKAECTIFAELFMTMESIIEKENIICGACNFKFERDREYKFCSNCFACTGCEIYYCPECDNEIVVTPVRSMKSRSERQDETNYSTPSTPGSLCDNK